MKEYSCTFNVINGSSSITELKFIYEDSLWNVSYRTHHIAIELSGKGKGVVNDVKLFLVGYNRFSHRGECKLEIVVSLSGQNNVKFEEKTLNKISECVGELNIVTL